MRSPPQRMTSTAAAAAAMSATLPEAATAPATAVRVVGGEDDGDVSYAVRLCASAADLLEAHKLRCTVFHEEQGFPLETEIDEYDPVSAHFLATATSTSSGATRTVGVIRWVPYPFPQPDPSFQPGADKDLPIGPVRDEPTVQRVFAQNTPPAAAAGAGAEAEAEAIATAPTLLPGGKLTRLAVAKEARGRHIGELLVRESEKWVLQAVRGAATPSSSGGRLLHSAKLVVSSQLPVIRFYTRLSYVPVGKQYDEEGAPHQRLEKTVVF